MGDDNPVYSRGNRPLAVSQIVGGAVLSASNPLPVFSGALTALAPVKKPLSNVNPTQLSTVSLPCKSLMLMGDPDMVGANVLIGIAGAGNQAVPLAAGQVMFLQVSNVNQLYGLAITNNDAVIYWPFN